MAHAAHSVDQRKHQKQQRPMQQGVVFALTVMSTLSQMMTVLLMLKQHEKAMAKGPTRDDQEPWSSQRGLLRP